MSTIEYIGDVSLFGAKSIVKIVYCNAAFTSSASAKI